MPSFSIKSKPINNTKSSFKTCLLQLLNMRIKLFKSLIWSKTRSKKFLLPITSKTTQTYQHSFVCVLKSQINKTRNLSKKKINKILNSKEESNSNAERMEVRMPILLKEIPSQKKWRSTLTIRYSQSIKSGNMII